MNDVLRMAPERLLQETQWLRALASTLAGAADADDLCQETWLSALEQPRHRIRGLRPWLRTVLHNTFQRSRESRAARTRRELAGCSVEEAPSTADLAARASLHRAVVDAVLALDEPHRSTVLLRFFDDRKPGEIARLHGVPVETVRSRLRRALAKLRARLDREVGNREKWMVVAAPGLLSRTVPQASGFGSPLAAASLLVGVLTMSVKAKVVVAAGIFILLAAGIGMTWNTWDWGPTEIRSPSPPVVAETPSDARSSPASAAAIPHPAPESRPLASSAPLAQPIQVTVHVSDEGGRDVAGAAVVATTGSVFSGTTDARGEVVLETAEPCMAAIRTEASGFAESTIESVAMTHGARIQVDLIPLAMRRIHVHDQAGVPVPGAIVELASESFFLIPPPNYRHYTQTTDDAGNVVFSGVAAIRWHVHVRAAGFVDAFVIAGVNDRKMADPVETTIVLERGVTLLIRFEDAATSAPVPGVPAKVSPDQERAFRDGMMLSDQNGVMAIGRPEGATTKVAVYGSLIADPMDLKVPPGQTQVTVRMSQPAPVACRVTRDDNSVVETAILEYDTPHQLLPVSAENGRFFVDGQGVQSSPQFRFLVPNGATAWRRVAPWRAETALVAHTSIRIKGQVVGSDGQPVPGALVTITGRQTSSPRLAPSQSTPTEVTTASDQQGFFMGTARGEPLHLIEVATAAGICARHFVAAARVRELNAGPVKVAIPFTRAADDGTCDIGRIIVPTRTGGMRISVASLLPDGTEVLMTPLGENADRFPERRAPVRTTLRAEMVGLPEGDYDVAIGPRGHVNLFGLRGTRVRVVGGEITEVAIPK